jgi:hypothetical protein
MQNGMTALQLAQKRRLFPEKGHVEVVAVLKEYTTHGRKWFHFPRLRVDP